MKELYMQYTIKCNHCHVKIQSPQVWKLKTSIRTTYNVIFEYKGFPNDSFILDSSEKISPEEKYKKLRPDQYATSSYKVYPSYSHKITYFNCPLCQSAIQIKREAIPLSPEELEQSQKLPGGSGGRSV